RVGEGLDGVLGDHAGRTLLELAVVVGEDVDRGTADAGVAHLVLGLAQSALAHGPDRTDRDGTPRGRSTHYLATQGLLCKSTAHGAGRQPRADRNQHPQGRAGVLRAGPPR